MTAELDRVQFWSFVGVLPPPYGGVTIFAKRKVFSWRQEGATVRVVDLSRLNWLKKIAMFFRLLAQGANTGIYINDLSGFALAAGWANLRGAKIYFHDHNYSLEPMRGWRGWLLKRCLARCDCILFDGAHSRNSYVSGGYLSLDKPFSVAPPFIPPDVQEAPGITENFPDSLRSFLSRHKPVIAGNAFKVVLDEQGRDLYGIDMTIELLKSLRRAFPDAGVVFAIAVEEKSEYLSALEQRIRDYGLTESFHIFTGNRELWPLFGMVDVMVRPTTTDGYGISIAEALLLKTPAVASDVCERPEGTTLFRCRDQSDFEDKVFECLRRAEKIKSAGQGSPAGRVC